ncbi:MAG: DsbA family oxidoreductase [Ardenticatenaceae bacterium]|nr:DsbA family oxidoreductase [Ardenticatenaceae bacterium]
MEKLKQSHNVHIQWRSFELRPAEGPPISPEYRARIEAHRPQLVAMAWERYGLEINSGPFGINSRPALVGAKFAEAQGVGEAYHDAVFRAYWQEAKDISDLNVLAELATAVGLDRDQFLAALNNPQFQQEMMADVEQAFQYGLNSVPALVYNSKFLVTGAQPYELLAQVAEKASGKDK